MSQGGFLSQVGSIAVAVVMVIFTLAGITYADKALSLWEKQQRAQAIDGCFSASSYTQVTVEVKDGKQVTKTDTFPISWMVDDCLKNKGIEDGYIRKDFSQSQ